MREFLYSRCILLFAAVFSIGLLLWREQAAPLVAGEVPPPPNVPTVVASPAREKPLFESARLADFFSDDEAAVEIVNQMDSIFFQMSFVGASSEEALRIRINGPCREVFSLPEGPYDVHLKVWRPGDKRSTSYRTYPKQRLHRRYRYRVLFGSQEAEDFRRFLRKQESSSTK